LIQDKGVFYPCFKRVNSKDFKEHYNIGETNRIVGTTPDYVGYSRSKIVDSRNFINEFFYNNFNTLKSNLSSSCFYDLCLSSTSSRVTFSAGFTTSHSQLKEYLKDNSNDMRV
jgi:hypothetical protein